MAERQPQATLIGDLIGSREYEDRASLQRVLDDALAEVNAELDPPQPLEATVGDEFQGIFASAAAAASAALQLRLTLLRDNEIDSRYGLGYGPVTVFRHGTPVSQDGPGWWSAREAIERSRGLAGVGRTAFLRTCFVAAEGSGASPEEARELNALLLCRDAIVTQMRPRSQRLLLGLVLGRTQAELAAEEMISQPAVSQDLAASGAYAVEAAERALRGALP